MKETSIESNDGVLESEVFRGVMNKKTQLREIRFDVRKEGCTNDRISCLTNRFKGPETLPKVNGSFPTHVKTQVTVSVHENREGKEFNEEVHLGDMVRPTRQVQRDFFFFLGPPKIDDIH